MFHINRETELNEALLTKMISKFNSSVKPRLRKYKEYYDGIQAIGMKHYADESKPCNKVVTNFCKNISDSYCGYLASSGCISYHSEYDFEEIMDILRYNDYETEDADFLLNALIYGCAAELMYTDEEAHTRFRLINPEQCFAVYDDSLSNDMLYFVRIYKKSEWDENNIYYVDLYSDSTIKHYETYGGAAGLKLLGEEVHYFSQCPANVFYLPDEKSIFDCIMSKQDSYNTVFNASLDDYEAFVDAFLCFNGVDAEAEDITAMKENRVLILPQDSSATWLTKADSSAGIETKLKRIQEDIYRIASCPDFSSDSFTGGVSSGIAIRYKLCGMENRAAKIASLMKQALQRRIEIICGMAAIMSGEEVFRDCIITMKRNIPADNNEIINIINNLKGTVSDATLLSQIPFINDVNAEIEAVRKEREANMAVYAFGEDEV